MNPPLKFFALIAVSTVAFFVSAAPGPAQDRNNRQRIAITSLADVDEDFAFMGEYFGSVQSPYSGREVIGIQVIAKGTARFEAAYFRGGLPGAGWDRSPAVRLSGERLGSQLSFVQGKLQVLIQHGEATVLHRGLHQLGRLFKIKRSSPTLGAPPPRGAIVLFDGSDTGWLDGARIDERGLLKPPATTRMPVSDFWMHIEFRTPYMPNSSGQARGNSGVYIQRRYEVQILDSFGLEGAINECGAIYRQQPPDVNMCLPPLTWQTYDIRFRAARWLADGTKIANARITLLHNGVAVHQNREIVAKTGAGRPEGPEPLPILFQDHRDPVVYRNLWIVPLEQAPDFVSRCATYR